MTKQLTIDLNEYLDLDRKIKNLEAEKAVLHRQLLDAKLGSTDGLARVMIGRFRSALEVAKYAMGMCSPEFARKWPMEALIDVSRGILDMPDATAHETETVLVIESFVRDIVHWNANRDESYKPPPEGQFEPGANIPTMASRATGSLPAKPNDGS